MKINKIKITKISLKKLKKMLLKNNDFIKLYNEYKLKKSYNYYINYLIQNISLNNESFLLEKEYIDISYFKYNNIIFNMDYIWEEFKDILDGDVITKVIFRKFKNDGSIIAVFPENVENNYKISCYMHVGQHFSIDYDELKKESTLATEEEYIKLKDELHNIGYVNIKVLKNLR